MWCSSTARQIVFHTPTRGTAHASPHDIPEFYIDRRQDAGEVDKQRFLAHVTLV